MPLLDALVCFSIETHSGNEKLERERDLYSLEEFQSQSKDAEVFF